MDSKPVIFSKIAKKDLHDILFYIDNVLSNSIAAKKFYEKVKKEVNNLSFFPKIGGEAFNNLFVKDDKIRKIYIDNYVMYYKVDENIIIILRIIYSKRHINELLIHN